MLNLERIDADFRDMTRLQALAQEAFPPKEYLAPSRMIAMAQRRGFDFWALYDGPEFIGFMTVMTGGRMAYLFFLAIVSQQRGRGYGGQALARLKERYAGRQQVVDMERLDDGAANGLQRQRRRRFYIHSGYQSTGWYISYLGVDYEILCNDADFDIEAFKMLMRHVAIEGFAPVYYQ